MPEENPEPVELEIGDYQYLELFQELSSIRGVGSGMGGVEPIKPSEIQSWSDIQGSNLQIPEIRLLLAMDSSYRSAIHREHARKNPKPDKSGKA